MNAPRFELSPTTRFADRVSDYARFRPSYPAAAIDAVLDGLPGDRLIAADIGAGTGISARLLAERGVQVFAVEPNPAMREGAEPHSQVTFIEGTAEATTLATASIDLVLCAQAFHWFRPQEAFTEFWRILRPGGRLALLVNERDHDDPMTRDYGNAILAATDRDLSEGQGALIDEALLAAHRTVRAVAFPNTQALSHEGLIGRARSSSYISKEGPRYDRLLQGLDDLWEKYRSPDGTVSLSYRTWLWVVEK